MTAVVGYPVHAVVTFTRRTNPNGVWLTDWTSACGSTGTSVGHQPFGNALNARKGELCKRCFPTGWHSAGLPDAPKEVPSCDLGN